MSNQNAKLPNSYIPNVIKTPATAALNSLKNTANNMFGFGGGNNNKGVVGNFVNNTTNRLSNAGAAITNAGTAVANKIGNIGSNLGNVSSNVANKVGNIGTNVASTVLPSNVVNTMESSSIPWGIIVVLILLGATVGLIVYFYEDLKQLINRLRGDSEPVLPTPMPPPPASEGKLAPAPSSMPMQTNTPPQNIDAVPPATAVEKLLPTKKEVFNISSNRFMYEDAAPLCKALGAELATYDQVKEAYEKGADWCNYGWTKGQLALFPTQKATWDKLQAGPEGQRMACGKVGLNGGHFDNPEMRFGVNCYGVKPSQSAHDASTKAKGYPLSPDALEFDRKVAKYRSEADHLDVLPFKEGSWNT